MTPTRVFQSISTRGELYQLVGFLATFVLLAVGVPLVYLRQPLHFDEAIWLVIADQMAQGNALYGDVYDHKPPGIFYVTLAVERFVAAFGRQLQFLAYGTAGTTEALTVRVLRLLNYGINALTAVLVFELGRRLEDRTTGMGASLVFLTAMSLPHFVGFHFLTEPWAILTTVVAAILLYEDRVVSDVAAGFALGIGVLFNQTVFLFGLAFIVFRAVQLRYRRNQSRDYLRETLRRFGHIGSGFAVPVSLVLAYFYSRGLLTELLFNTMYLPLAAYSPPFTVSGRILAFASALPVWLLAVGTSVWIGLQVVSGQRLEGLASLSAVQMYRDGGEPIVRKGVLFVVLWAVFVSYPGLRGFDAQHQLLFVFPPVALLSVIGARRLVDIIWQYYGPDPPETDRQPSRLVTASTVFVGILVVALVVSAGFNGVYASSVVSESRADQAEQSEAVGERVDGVAYTWPPQMNHLYYHTDTIEPAETYFMTVYDESVSDRVIEDLEAADTEYVIAAKGHVEDGEIVAARSKWFADDKVELAAYLNRRYEPVDETDRYVIFAATDGQSGTAG